METTAPFDLNRTIQRWRENLAQSPAFRHENLNELESHLRDSIVALQTSGLSAEEAFTIAVKRIGKQKSLEKEFEKMNGKSIWLDRILWMLIGFQVWIMISMFCSTITLSAGGIAGQMWIHRSKYSPLQRTFVQDHTASFGEIALNVVPFLMTPLALVLVTVFVWKVLLKSGGTWQRNVRHWLRRPVILAVVLFSLCLSFQVFTSFLQNFIVYPMVYDKQEMKWWGIVASQTLYALPQFIMSAILIAILARKRLKLKNA